MKSIIHRPLKRSSSSTHALFIASLAGSVQSNGDFTITVTVPDGASTVTLTATRESQTSTTGQ